MNEVMGRLRQVWRDHPEKRPRLDSPTYLRLTRQITEAEYHILIDERRKALGLPPVYKP